MFCDDNLLLNFLLPLRIASPSVSTQTDEMKFTFSRVWALGLVILGVVFNAVSLFSPWGILTSSSAYVYLSGRIVNGEGVLPLEDLFVIMLARDQLITVSNLINAAIIAGCAGVVLDLLAERRVPSLPHRRVISYSLILASSGLSFTAVAMLTLTEIDLSWGAHLALVGGILVVLGILMKELKVEVIVEREMSDQEE